MNEILTAEELLKDLPTFNNESGFGKHYVIEAMIEFAKYHVQQALIAAIDVPLLDHSEDNIELVNSILNAYSLDNIK